jgi:hypothetical protein
MSKGEGRIELAVLKLVETRPWTVRQICDAYSGTCAQTVQRAFKTLYRKDKIHLRFRPVLTASALVKRRPPIRQAPTPPPPRVQPPPPRVQPPPPRIQAPVPPPPRVQPAPVRVLSPKPIRRPDAAPPQSRHSALASPPHSRSVSNAPPPDLSAGLSPADALAARIAAEVERQKTALINAGRRTVT